MKKIIILTVSCLFSWAAWAQGNVAVSTPVSAPPSSPSYTVLPFDYAKVTQQSEEDIKTLMALLSQSHEQDANTRVRQAIHFFTDRPYIGAYAEGEGDWQDAKTRGQLHIQQAPIYRTDQFVCNTLVQTVLAVIQSKTIDAFNRHIIDIEYGAAGDKSIHYYNRNNFISGDFNPVNQAAGILKDVTQEFPHDTTSALIDRANWFAFQQRPSSITSAVHIIDTGDAATNQKNGEAMLARFLKHYPKNYHVFKPERVNISYIPKEKLAVYGNGSSSDTANEALLQQLPTPSVAEIVRDTKKWTITGKNIKEVIGTELNVSHLGMLYRQRFVKGEVIFQNISCEFDVSKKKVCTVTPVTCNKQNGCNEVMYAAATDAYPDGYYYYQDSNGRYQCSHDKPENGAPVRMCNQVMSMPLGDYFTAYRYGHHPYMENASILGMNVEKILD